MKPVSIQGYRKKQIRKLRKEERDLRKKEWALGYKKLEKPIRHGWFIELTILKQLERYKFKPEIDEIIEKFEIIIWGRTKEEAQKKWNCAQSKYLIYRGVPTISPKTYSKLSEKAQRHCSVFFYRKDKKWRRRYYVKIPKNAYKIAFKRAYVTHSKIIDPDIKERLDLINQHLLKNGWFGPGLEGYSYRDTWQTPKVKVQRKQTRSKLKKHQFSSLIEIKKEYEWERN